MGLFSRRRTREADAEHVAVPAKRIDEVIDQLSARVARAMEEERPPDHVLRALQIGLPFLAQRELSDQAIYAGQAAARLGYFSRTAEYERFQAAREADLDLFDALEDFIDKKGEEGESAYHAITEFAAGMVLSEPGRPTVEQGGPLWAVPGTGGDLRLALADNLMTAFEDRVPPDVGYRDLISAWKFGFYLRTLEEFFDENSQG